ncbi:sugar phosphate isomerase/epimerase family protein [Mucisphaera calidilacus]|uniref:Inosose dehydratase n=1 Tax=Mucisphaera calidilacus TaxID=2527982 RepID=A0A518BZA8_9BACT|nr:sugar phosphate isomerase/epimerase family protein [Mucisphaera calidilacus]QDU72310.1 Inosose dehydratase [Mucisphaera calidilacus]
MSEEGYHKRLAACTWSFQPESPASLLDKLNTCGIRRVQLAMNPLVDDAAWAEIGTMLADAGVTIVSGMYAPRGEDYSTLETIRATGGIVQDQLWDENRELFVREAEWAQQLGIKVITFHAGFIPEQETDPLRATVADRLAQLAVIAAEAGIELLLETGQETAEDLEAFLAELGDAGVGVNFDPANMILYGKGDPLEAVERLMPFVGQVHIKDALPTPTPGTWGSEERVGDGAVDWSAFLARLDEGGYTGDLVIEREAGDNRVDDIAHAAGVITDLLRS